MKKLCIIMLTVLLLAGCSSSKGRLARTDAVKVSRMFDQQETFVLMISREGCESCEVFDPVISQLVREYPLTVYYIDCPDDDDVLMDNLINDYLYVLDVVPTIYLADRGNLLDRHDGGMTYEDLLDWLGNYGYITR